MTDAAVLGRIVDGALLVVRSDYAPMELVQLSVRKLEDVQVNLEGTILTRYNAKRAGRQSGYYYSYHSYYSYGNEKGKVKNVHLKK